MLKRLSFIVTIPLIAFFVIFALSNRQLVELTFWPFPLTLAAPLYLFFLLLVFISFAAGALAMWFAQHSYRADARRLRRENEKLRAAVAPKVMASTITATTAPTTSVLIGKTVAETSDQNQ